jgi:cellulose synthase/poly-beta-1,6-N-acetylglucosamine synthase-like glycosyltransferase
MAQFAWVCAWLAIIPAVTAVWNLLLYRPPPRRGVKAAVSVLIPARNEADKIAAAVNAVLANGTSGGGIDLEVVVLDDHSTDGTTDIVRAIADPRVRVEQAPPLPPGWSGKQHACWHLAHLARHPLLVFVDADVRPGSDWPAVSRIRKPGLSPSGS